MRRLIALIVSAASFPAIAEVSGDAEIFTCGTGIVRAECISRKESDDPQRKFDGYCKGTKSGKTYNNNPPNMGVLPGAYIVRLKLEMPFSHSTWYTVDNQGFFKTPLKYTPAFGNYLTAPPPGGLIE